MFFESSRKPGAERNYFRPLARAARAEVLYLFRYFQLFFSANQLLEVMTVSGKTDAFTASKAQCGGQLFVCWGYLSNYTLSPHPSSPVCPIGGILWFVGLRHEFCGSQAHFGLVGLRPIFCGSQAYNPRSDKGTLH